MATIFRVLANDNSCASDVNFNIDSEYLAMVKKEDMKYNEDKIIKEITDYIKSTYGQHYVSNATGDEGFQVQDLLRSVGIDKDFCQANAIKYLARFGKKNGRNRKDLLKAIHYVILLMSSEDATTPFEDGESRHKRELSGRYPETQINTVSYEPQEGE